MGRYFFNGAATNTDNKPIVSLHNAASPTRRVMITEVIIGCIATPAEQACGYELLRVDDVGNGGTSITPASKDPNNGVCACTAKRGTYTTDPTLTASVGPLLYIPLHQRATFRWVAGPGGELVIPNVAADGFAVTADTPTAAFSTQVGIEFEE